MWYDRKNYTHEEVEEENKRMLMCEERDYDELDDKTVDDMLKSYEEYEKKKLENNNNKNGG